MKCVTKFLDLIGRKVLRLRHRFLQKSGGFRFALRAIECERGGDANRRIGPRWLYSGEILTRLGRIALHEIADGKNLVIPAEGMIKGVFFIRIPEGQVKSARTVVEVGVFRNGEQLETIKVKFIGPVSKSSDMKRD